MVPILVRMSVEIVMPKLSDTMEEGTILKWLKQVGDTVARGEVLAEVETDKADMELEAAAAGVLREITVHAGESAAVGAVIALVEETGAGADTPHAAATTSNAAPKSIAAVPGRPAPRTTGSGERGPRPAAAAPPDGKATPAARKLAEERGVDLRGIHGSGPGGRVVTDDVPAERPSAPEDAGRVPLVERHELSRMRQSIARRMSEAFRDIPHFYVTAEIDMTEAARLKDALQRSELFATPISYTHMVLKATALALARHPRLNASYGDGAIELKSEINLGMAVAVDDGLIVPVIRHVDEMPLADLAVAARRLVEQARRGRFGRDDLSGGTFTVSNLGMYGVEAFTAIITLPQSAAIAVGAVQAEPVVRDGAVVPGQIMRFTVSADHRVTDGAGSAQFAAEVKRLLENPLQLLL